MESLTELRDPGDAMVGGETGRGRPEDWQGPLDSADLVAPRPGGVYLGQAGPLFHRHFDSTAVMRPGGPQRLKWREPLARSNADSPARETEGFRSSGDRERRRHGHLSAHHGPLEGSGCRGRVVLHGPPAARQARPDDQSEEGQPAGGAQARRRRTRGGFRRGEEPPGEGARAAPWNGTSGSKAT